MADEIPAQHIGFISEWQFMGTVTAPPATGQVRLNHSTQKNATLMWIHRVTINGNDASAYLISVKSGTVLRLRDKDDQTKWQSFTVSGAPVNKTDYWEYPVVWLAGDQPVVQQRILIDIPTTSVSVNVSSPAALQALMGSVTISGQLVTREFAFPFQGKYYTSPGMTIRQFYASQAMMGFISATPPAANLIGRLAEFAFTVADSMIAHEAREAAGYRPPLVGADRNAPIPLPGVPPVAAAQQKLAGRAAKPESVPVQPSAKVLFPRKIIT